MNYIYLCLTPFLISLIISVIIINFWEKFFLLGVDRYKEVQKIHVRKSYRLGIISILTSLILSCIIFQIELKILFSLFLILPLLIACFFEDLVGNLNIGIRIISIFVSVTLIIYFYDSSLKEIDNPLLSQIFFLYQVQHFFSHF